MKQRRRYSPVAYEERGLFDEATLTHPLRNRGRRQLAHPVRPARGTQYRDVCATNASHRSIRQPQLDQSPIPNPGPYVYAVFRPLSRRAAIDWKPNLSHVLHFHRESRVLRNAAASGACMAVGVPGRGSASQAILARSEQHKGGPTERRLQESSSQKRRGAARRLVTHEPEGAVACNPGTRVVKGPITSLLSSFHGSITVSMCRTGVLINNVACCHCNRAALCRHAAG